MQNLLATKHIIVFSVLLANRYYIKHLGYTRYFNLKDKISYEHVLVWEIELLDQRNYNFHVTG